jgi:tetratricopeptide (TPR) repeat protein
MPFSELDFDPELPAVRVATEMRQKYGLVPGIEISNPTKVSEEVKLLRDQGVDDDKLLYNLAQSLNVDFVVWGNYDDSSDQIRLTSATYKKVDGSKVAEVGESVAKEGDTGQKSLVFTVAEKLAANTAGALAGLDDGMAKTFALVEKNQDVADAFNAPLSESLRAQREILAGLEALEGALGFSRGDENASSLLDLAALKLNSALSIDGDNPFIHSLLASVYYNQAANGESEESAPKFLDAWKKAYELLDNATTEDAKQEIAADHALLVEKDAAKAIEIYERLAKSERPAVARRAHWMLAGIQCGDWGVDEKVIDVAKAREHMIAILAHHLDSPEGKYFKVALQWDAEEGTRNPRYHKDNNEMMRFASKD